MLLALTACGTSPEPNFYTLGTAQGPVTAGIKDTVKVVQPDLPPFLDRPDFVSQTSRYQISINETANWAEPLASMFERTLADDLQQRLPRAVVETDADDDAPSAPRYIVETKLQQFNTQANGQIILRGEMQLTDLQSHNQSIHTPVTFTLANASNDPAVIASGLSTLLGQYADQITASLAACGQQQVK